MLRSASYFAAASHLAALAFAGFALAPGTAPDDVRARVAWIAAHPARWAAGWGAFIAAGIGLVAWVVLVRRRLDPRGADEALGDAVALSVVGLGLESAGHGVSALALPHLARQLALEGVVAAEGAARLASTVLAPLAFAAATLLVVRALAASGLGGRAATLAGYVNVACALAMTAAGLLEAGALIPVATAGVVLSLSVLTLTVGRAAGA